MIKFLIFLLVAGFLYCSLSVDVTTRKSSGRYSERTYYHYYEGGKR